MRQLNRLSIIFCLLGYGLAIQAQNAIQPVTGGKAGENHDTLAQSGHKLSAESHNGSKEIRKESCYIKDPEISGKKPVLKGEIAEINTFYHELLKQGSFLYKPGKKSVSVFLVTHGRGIIKQGSRQFEVNGVNLFVPSVMEEASILADDGNLGMLEIIITLSGDEMQSVKNEQNILPYFVDYTKCRQYKEAIKSEKTISRMILPENIIPRFCMGSVETTGPDEVGAHAHPMLEQLFFGLTKNDCTVTADGMEAAFEENTLLHIPLGSMHGAIVKEGKILNYIWMDHFRSLGDMKYIKENHVMKDE
jgi:hypothetical protein